MQLFDIKLTQEEIIEQRKASGYDPRYNKPMKHELFISNKATIKCLKKVYSLMEFCQRPIKGAEIPYEWAVSDKVKGNLESLIKDMETK